MSLKDRIAQGSEQPLFLPQREKEKPEVSTLMTVELYMRDFGFFPGKEYISPEYVEQFYIALKLDRYIKDLKISIATEPDNESPKQLIEKEVQKERSKTTYTEGEREALNPTNTMDIDTISDLNQLPEIMPNEWLLEEVDSNLFLQKATEYALLRPIWTEVTRTPTVSTETVLEKELVEVQAPKTEKKQHAFVLRDISGSTFGTDNRYVMIRGLALAFLRRGYLQGSEMGLRDFDGYVYPLQKGKTQQELRVLAEYLMTSASGANTDIEAAIRQAVEDIKQGGVFHRADILLLTDGEASLGQNPLCDIKLHTIMVGEEGANPELQRWSETFQFLSPESMPSLLQPKKSEIVETGKSTSKLIEKIDSVHTQQDAKTLSQEIESLQQIIGTMRRHDQNDNQNLSEQEQQLQELLHQLDSSNRAKLIEANNKAKEKKEQEEAAKQAELQRQELLRKQKEEEDLKKLIEELAGKGKAQETSNQKTVPSSTGNSKLPPQREADPLSLLRYLSRVMRSGVHWSIDKTKEIDEKIKHVVRGGETDES